MTDNILKACRRVVTGLDSDGKSSPMFDTNKDDVNSIPDLPGFRWLDLWAVDKIPSGAATEDRASGAPIFPEENGCVFRIFEIDPDGDDVKELYKSPDTHPLMNAAPTTDFIYVMEGEIHVVFEGGETHLKKGDTFIQQGTRHAWSNRGTAPCRMLAVLVGGKVAADAN